MSIISERQIPLPYYQREGKKQNNYICYLQEVHVKHKEKKLLSKSVKKSRPENKVLPGIKKNIS